MSEQLKSEFAAINGINTFHRVDGTHPLNLYLGRDQMARYTLLLISPNETQRIFSSQIIAVDVGQRIDGQWALSLSLSDEKYMDLFCHFCDDIIRSSRSILNMKEDMIFVCGRYDKWQEMLKKNRNGLLTEASIKGLIGELLFLKNYLFPKYGINESLDSWIGPEHADQDFVCPEMWYEVKATARGNESVGISSIEQLDLPVSGELVIVYLDKTSHTDPTKITLNKLVSDIDDQLRTFEQHRHFRDILLEQEYIPRKEYDQYAYSFSVYSRYDVGSEFPSLRRINVPDSVINVSYRLSISGISKYLKED